MKDLPALVTRAQSGDVEAFNGIVRRLQDKARSYAYSVLHDRDLAEDAAQEAFVQAYRGLSQLKDTAAFEGWFRAIVVNQSRRLIRGKRVSTVPLEDAEHLLACGQDPAAVAEKRDLADRVADAINALPEVERAVSDLYYFQGCSQGDIAEILQLPVTTVNNRLHSSRRLLRSRFADLSEYSEVERMSRSKSGRRWLPANLASRRETDMALQYEPTTRRLLRGDYEVCMRVMAREDIPAMRRFDQELAEKMPESNQKLPPGRENGTGGPWAEDDWLTEHFDKMEKRGDITLLAEDPSGNIVAFADLMRADEPEPFGDNLTVQTVDYFMDYYYLGMETILLEEAEKVARAAGLPSLYIGTNTSSGDYPTLRQFGLQVFYEYDEVRVRCRPVPDDWKLDFRTLSKEEADLSGLIKVGHWSPTRFSYLCESDDIWIAKFEVEGQRVLFALSPCSPAEDGMPIITDEICYRDLYVPPDMLKSSSAMSMVIRQAAFLAGKAGMQDITLPYPSDLEIAPGLIEVMGRWFRFAWMRKRLDG